MCDQIPADECPECAYVLPDEHDIDPSSEMDGDKHSCTYCGSTPAGYVDFDGDAMCANCCDPEPDPDRYRDEQIAWDMEMNA